AMGTCGVCKFGMKKLDSSRMSDPNSFSSGPVVGHCHFCKNPRFLRRTAMPGFRSAEFGFAATSPKFLPVTRPRYTVKPRGITPMSGASSRHSAHQREGFFAFRTLCGIFHEVPQAWILYRSPAMVERARSVGIPTFENHNGRMMEGDGGGSIIDLIVRDGRRHSVFRSYAFPFMDRPNLTVLTNALVTKLILERKRAAGVEIE